MAHAVRLQQAVIGALEHTGPSTMVELVEATGRSRDGVHDAVRKLRRQGIVYIKDYQPQLRSGRWAPVYALGLGKTDAEEPKDVEYRRARREGADERDRVRRTIAPKVGAVWRGLIS